MLTVISLLCLSMSIPVWHIKRLKSPPTEKVAEVSRQRLSRLHRSSYKMESNCLGRAQSLQAVAPVCSSQQINSAGANSSKSFSLFCSSRSARCRYTLSRFPVAIKSADRLFNTAAVPESVSCFAIIFLPHLRLFVLRPFGSVLRQLLGPWQWWSPPSRSCSHSDGLSYAVLPVINLV